MLAAKIQYEYLLVSRKDNRATSCIYLNGKSFLEAVKNKKKVTIPEGFLDNLNIYRSSVVEIKTQNRTLIGVVSKKAIAYDWTGDRISEGMKLLLGEKPSTTILTLPKPIEQKQAPIEGIYTPIKYKIGLKITHELNQ